MKVLTVPVEILIKDNEIYCHRDCNFFRTTNQSSLAECVLFSVRIVYQKNGFLRYSACVASSKTGAHCG